MSQSILQFGDFVLDLESADLTKDGRIVTFAALTWESTLANATGDAATSTQSPPTPGHG